MKIFEIYTPGKHPTTSLFGQWLERMGFKYPTHEEPGQKYIDINGGTAFVHEDRPFGLVDYTEKTETYYKTPEEARANAIDGNLWQVLHMYSGEIIYEPEELIKDLVKQGNIDPNRDAVSSEQE